MRPPSPIWETTYRHDRRFHRHRCRCCNRIINDGERVLMTRVRGHRGNKTGAIHLDPRPQQPNERAAARRPILGCADLPHSEGGWTWRDAMEAWGIEHLRACGHQIPAHPMSRPGAKKSEAA